MSEKRPIGFIHPENVKVSSGANSVTLDVKGEQYTLAALANKAKDVLNLTGDHDMILVNGREIRNPAEFVLNGDEDIEFVKRAGEKGAK